MSARRKYARTIDEAFHWLTVDGKLMSSVAALTHFERLASTRKKDMEWKKAFRDVLFQLAIGGRSITASTSGTTGPPKWMTIPRRDLVNSARVTADAFQLREGDRTLLCLPCEYIAGKMMLVRAMALGLDLHVIDPRGSVIDNLGTTTDRFRFTAMVPLQLHRAIQEDRARVEEQFDIILLGGGPVSAVLQADLQGLGTHVFQGYGSTETVTHVALRRVNGGVPEELYTAIANVTFSTDERGCLVVRTPHLTRKEHVTNDLVQLTDDRHFRWLGRIDNVILSGGKKIFPEELEVRTAGVIPFPHFFTAYPDDLLGQAVTLVLETDQKPEDVLEELMAALLSVLAKHELPRRVVALRNFHRTRSGKVLRQV